MQYPHASLDHEPFSLHGISVESTDVLVDTNLGTNTQLLPSAETLDVGLVHIPHDAVDTSDKTSPVQIADAQPIEDTLNLKRSDVKILDDPLSGPPVDEKNSKLDGPFPLVNDEEDVCPICLEGTTMSSFFQLTAGSYVHSAA